MVARRWLRICYGRVVQWPTDLWPCDYTRTSITFWLQILYCILIKHAGQSAENKIQSIVCFDVITKTADGVLK